jgi:hypothetical protein
VRGVGHEAALLLERHVEAREQFVERAREAAQLAALVADGQTLAEILRVDVRGAFAHLDDGREALAREEVAAEAREE